MEADGKAFEIPLVLQHINIPCTAHRQQALLADRNVHARGMRASVITLRYLIVSITVSIEVLLVTGRKQVCRSQIILKALETKLLMGFVLILFSYV